MANSLRPIWHMAGAVCVAGTLWIAPAKATENTGVVTEAAALAATTAVTADVVTTAAVTTADVAGPARSDVPEKIARANADATTAPTMRQSKHPVAAATRYRRVAFTRPGLSCSGVWCGRHYVLMLGVAY